MITTIFHQDFHIFYLFSWSFEGQLPHTKIQLYKKAGHPTVISHLNIVTISEIYFGNICRTLACLYILKKYMNFPWKMKITRWKIAQQVVNEISLVWADLSDRSKWTFIQVDSSKINFENSLFFCFDCGFLISFISWKSIIKLIFILFWTAKKVEISKRSFSR